ncbi:hypothetical protein Glove_197g35 [Diversispora epigaea]|uniref:Uncharacterized protein n=1 Tax=Diversispora epigaea TaxID=1348612 RepID=A0A397IV44_9GLOM|nr:hypothetical protein Glove_197g35 [Diversispora epigaea]
MKNIKRKICLNCIHIYYCDIIEVDRGQKSNKKLKNPSKKKILEPTELIEDSNDNIDTTFSSNIKIMTKVLYEQQCRKCANLELDPIKFKNIIEGANSQLKGQKIYCWIVLFNCWIMKQICQSTQIRKHVIKTEKHFTENKNILHIYNIDDYHFIHEKHQEYVEEQSMKGLQLIGFKEQNLYSIFDYINTLKIILSINDKIQHLKEFVTPIVADWPEQIFIRKALHKTLSEFQSNFPQDIRSFLPILVFLSDLFYWKDINHSFFDALQKHLPCFNDYYVENTHSKIRTNISSNTTVDNIIKQAYVIRVFENVNSFLKRIEKRANTLTQEDFGDNNINNKEGKEQSGEIEIQDISNSLEIEINKIENW